MRDVPSLLFCVEQEKREQARREEARCVKVRGIERGIATAFNVTNMIYSMNAREFRELASDFPALSRIYFHPDKKKRNRRRFEEPLKDPNFSFLMPIVFLGLILVSVIYGIRAFCGY